MAYTNINSEDRLVQETFADHLKMKLGWESVYAWNNEIFGQDGTLGRTDPRDVVLTRDLRAAYLLEVRVQIGHRLTPEKFSSQEYVGSMPCR
jgi:hypothetical protein